MTFSPIPSALPLLVSGLPRTFQSWLRAAGIPISSYTTGHSIHEFLDEHAGRFLLYDSRNPTSRAEAETALQFEREIIDVSPGGLLDAQGFSSQHRFRYEELLAHDWILLVQQELRSRQGIWLRIHDLPAPYDSVVFTDGLPHQPELRLVSESLSVIRDPSGRASSSGTQQRHHVLLSDEMDDFNQYGCWWTTDVRRQSSSQLMSDNPTVWKVNSSQFARWWAYRESLTVEIQQKSEQLRIVAPMADQAEWTPFAELWRKGHVARFPLSHSLMTLQRSSMAYGKDRFRHSAGLFLSQGRPMPAASPVSASA